LDGLASTREVIGSDAGSRKGRVAHERVDRGKAGVAGASAVVPGDLEMVEEVQDQRGVEVSEAQRRGRFAEALFDVAEEQLEGVPVALDGPGAGAALVDQATQEEVLDELIEATLGRSHGAPVGGWPVKTSNRSATTSINSGTADRY
jgi:hypothetical protein